MDELSVSQPSHAERGREMLTQVVVVKEMLGEGEELFFMSRGSTTVALGG